MIERLIKILIEEGGAPGSSIHSWRCEYPDRYGECDCLSFAAVRLSNEVISTLIDRILSDKDQWYELDACVPPMRTWIAEQLSQLLVQEPS